MCLQSNISMPSSGHSSASTHCASYISDSASFAPTIQALYLRLRCSGVAARGRGQSAVVLTLVYKKYHLPEAAQRRACGGACKAVSRAMARPRLGPPGGAEGGCVQAPRPLCVSCDSRRRQPVAQAMAERANGARRRLCCGQQQVNVREGT